MAVLLLTSSVSFAVDMHFCKGELKSISFWGKAPSCHEQATAKITCPHHQKMMADKGEAALKKSNCCDNHTVQVEAEHERQTQTSGELELKPSSQQFLLAYTCAFLLPQPAILSSTRYQHYKPPLIYTDIPVLTQSFLL
ncbi:MAG: hypothetical protein RIC19_18900 [Phaeodactylibacter sp.]|uniref:HYC_CC_PP family protein n=1 Tax=Phaeodactylibacter sp. TaxID=1940289 RepID=UPI0032EB80B2